MRNTRGNNKVSLRKPSDLFDNESQEENDIPLVEVSEDNFNKVFDVLNTYQSYLSDFEEKLKSITSLSEQVNSLQKELENSIKKEDLDKAVLSQFLYINETISNLGDNVKLVGKTVNTTVSEGSEKKKLKKPSDLFVEETTEICIPLVEVSEGTFNNVFDVFNTYQTYLNDFEDKFNNVNELSDEVSSIREEIESALKKEDLDKAILSQLLYVNETIANIQDNIKDINQDKLEEIREDANFLLSKVEKFVEIDDNHDKRIEYIEDYLKKSALSSFKKNLFEKVVRIESEVTVNENRLRNQNKELERIETEIFKMFQDLKVSEIVEDNKRLKSKVRNLEKLYEEIKDRKTGRVIEQSSFDFPESLNPDDPLVPLDQKYVTLEQLQQHYRLFINRIQQQLSTLGGGGETQFRYLDDVDFDTTYPEQHDGRYLKYSKTSDKIVFGGDESWIDGIDGPYTMSKVGIGTTNIRYSPYYDGADNPDDVAQHDLALLVEGDVRITGILTVGKGSITLDSDSGRIASGETELVNASGGASYQGNVYVGGLYAGIYTGSNISIRCDEILEGTIKSPPSLVIDPSPDGSEGDFIPYGLVGIQTGNVSIAGTDRITGIETAAIQVGQDIDEVDGVISYGTKVSDIGQSYVGIDKVSIGSTTNHVFRFGSRLPSSGTVTIKGDLIVEGKETTIESQTLEIADKTIGIASASTPLNNQQLDGAGIIIHGSDSNKSLTWDNSNSRLAFSTDIYAPKYHGDGSSLSIGLGDLTNVDASNLGAGTTNYLLVYDPSVSGFKFVDPTTLGINNDFNPDPDIDDFGSYE